MSTLLRHRLNMLKLRAKARFPSEEALVVEEKQATVALYQEKWKEKRSPARLDYEAAKRAAKSTQEIKRENLDLSVRTNDGSTT